MKKIKVAVNGCGRIGRAVINQSLERDDLEIVAVNDLSEPKDIAYLLNYDSVYGKRVEKFSFDEINQFLVVGDKKIKYLQEKDPKDLPWADLDIDVVVESTGVFNTFESSSLHIEAGAKRVVLSAPSKDEPKDQSNATVLMGVNEEALETCSISSNASCTTNAVSPLISILQEKIGIEKAILNTVHAYTISQSVVDSFNKKNPRLGRAAADNIVPTTTGAATATGKVITSLEGKFDGIALRVPVIAGSVADITFISSRDTTVEEVNQALIEGSKDNRWDGIFAVTDEPLVSSDIKNWLVGSVADLSFTKVVDGNLVKVLAWYDNEAGYAHTLIEHVVKTGSYVQK